MLLWIALIVVVFILAAGVIVFSLYRKVNRQKEVVLLNLKILQTELDEKKTILEELAGISLGLVSSDVIDALKAELGKDEDGLRAEKGKVTILQAEIEAVDIRLRELEEIERELEASGLEAARELELLRAQERDMESRNARLYEQLESCAIQLDKLSAEAKGDAELTAAIAKAKSELNTGQMQLKHFEGEIPQINQKYMSLKRAYDALDIEYAQLYEKQSQAS